MSVLMLGPRQAGISILERRTCTPMIHGVHAVHVRTMKEGGGAQAHQLPGHAFLLRGGPTWCLSTARLRSQIS